METLFNILQPLVAALMVVTILLQQRGTGLGGAFGGGAEVYSAKRGAEKIIFRITITLAIIFIGLGIARLIIP